MSKLKKIVIRKAGPDRRFVGRRILDTPAVIDGKEYTSAHVLWGIDEFAITMYGSSPALTYQRAPKGDAWWYDAVGAYQVRKEFHEYLEKLDAKMIEEIKNWREFNLVGY